MTSEHDKRVDSTELPSKTEVLNILKEESQRKAVRFDFVQKNNSVFNIHRQLSKLAESDDSWIDEYKQLTLEELMLKVDENHADLTRYIKTHQNEADLYKAFCDALISKTEITKSEALFVFGAATNARIERAVELYKDSVAQKIIISGNSPHYVEGTQSEAVRMAEYAKKNGVPLEDLIIEEASITLPDNVKRTIDLLETMNWRPASLVIVATNFVLTRAKMEWYKFCPWDIEIIPVAAHPKSLKFTADGWSSDDATIALVLNEYVKIVVESKIDLMRREGEIA